MASKVPILLIRSGSHRLIPVACSRYVLALLFTVMTVVCIVSVNIPLSLVYKRFHKLSYTLDLAKKINNVHYDQALNYLRNVASTSKSTNQHLQAPLATGQLVICVVTADRSYKYDSSQGKMGYLIQTAASLDYFVKNDIYFPNTTLFMCNVERSPSAHRDAEYLKQFIPYVERYGSNSFGRIFPDVTGFVSKHDSFARGKEIEDYIFCLNSSLSLQAPYILMLEDDIIVERDLFKVVNYTLTAHNLVPKNTSTPRRKFSYLKLYYPPRWQGYAFEFDRIMELVCVGSIGGSLLVLYLYLSRRGNSNYSTKCSYFVLGAMLSVVCVSVIGRQNMIEFRRLSPQLFKFSRAPGCCTPAMLYSREVVTDLNNYLLTHSDINKDLAIYAFAEESKVPGYQLEPNLAYHIGMYSSLKRSYKPPEEFLHNVPLF